jgi:hypothetical protein
MMDRANYKGRPQTDRLSSQQPDTMKTSIIASLSAAALWLTGAPETTAQEPVSTGIVQGVAPKTGTLTIRSTQTARPITFYGMEKANIFSVDGSPALITDLEPGMPVTVQYAVRGDRWFISKVILSSNTQTTLTPVVPNATVASPALRSPAARDGDITTQPGSKAAVDFDITTQPTGRAAVDGDITTRPTGNAAAATDGDRTTQPGSESGAHLRRRAP